MKLSVNIKDALRTGNRSWIFMALVIILVAIIRLHLLGLPFERDEGEYAYTGSLLLKGIPPYIQAYNMKLPGIYAAYAVLLAIFGKTYAGVRLGVLIMNALTSAGVFILGKRLVNPVVGSLAGATFAVLSVNIYLQGMMANAEHFVIFFAVAGLVVLLHAIDSGRKKHLFLSGLLLGTGFMMKQHGMFFIAFALVYLLWALFTRERFNLKVISKGCATFLAGALLPFTATCLAFYLAGDFGKFWFWTFTYTGQYVSLAPLELGLHNLKINFPNIVLSSLPIWGLFSIGVITPLWDRKSRNGIIFLFGLLLFSFIAVTPGLYFRKHYFILTLPAVSLFAGAGASALAGLFLKYLKKNRPSLRAGLAIFLTALSIAFTLYYEREILFFTDPPGVVRALYQGNPFPESVEIAKYIRKNSGQGDYIAVLGSEPQIYVYSDRPSATPYIYMYPLMEPSRYALEMQKDLIRNITGKKPLYIVYIYVSNSWLRESYSPSLIFNWSTTYLPEYYDRVGVIDIHKDGTDYFWDESARELDYALNHSVAVFKRRDGR